MTDNENVPVKVYFRNLNTIRFIAAFLVIVHHIEQLKSMFNVPNDWANKVISIIGPLGVVLFFVLSGFLISYLLFKEKEVTKTINIRNFYIRRILRIWPLYFLIIFSSFFIFPFIHFFTIPGYNREVIWHNLFYKFSLSVVFLPNLVLTEFGMIPYASQTWSIGAEEQFYLVWPFLNKYFKNKWLLMFSVIFIYEFIALLFTHLPDNKYINIFNNFWASTPIDCMAIGGIFAVIIYENSSTVKFIRKIIFSKLIQITTLLVTIFLILNGFSFPHFDFEFYSVLFGILICNFAFNTRRIFSMETVWSNYLGKISYGLYMFHPIAIVFSIKLLQYFNLVHNYFLYPLVLIIVVIISTLSYEFFEKKFIHKKIRYSNIISGDNAKEN